jgi:5-methyltetrahydrofolate--homocysteine methyltransferase
MGEYAVMARDCGATIIGGCCGTMPDHLRAMRTALENTPRGERPTLEAISERLGGFSSEDDGLGEGGAKRERRGRRRS